MRRQGPIVDAQAWLQRMETAFPDVKAADRLSGQYEPAEGARFFFNGQPRQHIADAQFAALLRHLAERANLGAGAARAAAGRSRGTAANVVGEARGQARGNALRWSYTLRLPVGERTYDVQFDDWMFLMDDRVMLNRARMSKFGVHLGDVTLPFHKP